MMSSSIQVSNGGKKTDNYHTTPACNHFSEEDNEYSSVDTSYRKSTNGNQSYQLPYENPRAIGDDDLLEWLECCSEDFLDVNPIDKPPTAAAAANLFNSFEASDNPFIYQSCGKVTNDTSICFVDNRMPQLPFQQLPYEQQYDQEQEQEQEQEQTSIASSDHSSWIDTLASTLEYEHNASTFISSGYGAITTTTTPTTIHTTTNAMGGQHVWTETDAKQLINHPTDPVGKFMRDEGITAEMVISLNLMGILTSAPRKMRTKYGPRRFKTDSELERKAKERNRRNARDTRRRKKIFIKVLEIIHASDSSYSHSNMMKISDESVSSHSHMNCYELDGCMNTSMS